jgi:hydroxyacylglutathione hydrolase
VRRHYVYTLSAVAWRVLSGWKQFVQQFVKVMPVEYHGVVPTNFDMAVSVVAIGQFQKDHFEASQTFARGEVMVALHPDEEKFLKEVGGQFYSAMGSEMPKIKISFYLEEGELKVGSKTFQILHTPGHSPGSISIYWPEKKALFTGDVVFPMGVGRTDFPGGDGMLLRDSIEKLAQLDSEWLLAGHGEVIKGKKNIQRNFAYIRSNYYDYL